jgi:hypothetical protein
VLIDYVWCVDVEYVLMIVYVGGRGRVAIVCEYEMSILYVIRNGKTG